MPSNLYSMLCAALCQKIKFYTCSQCEPWTHLSWALRFSTTIRLLLTIWFFFSFVSFFCFYFPFYSILFYVLFSACSTFWNGCDIKCNIWTAYERLSFYNQVIDRPMDFRLWLRRAANIEKTVTELTTGQKQMNKWKNKKSRAHRALTQMRQPKTV